MSTSVGRVLSERLRGIVPARTVGGTGEAVEEPAYQRIVWRVLFGTTIVLSTLWVAGFYAQDGRLFLDAHIYYRATAAWIGGGNPWTTTYQGVPFAGLPPTLLLNLPLLPLGEAMATAFWVVANTLAIVLIVHRLHLPLWVVALHPVVEGWLGASPDLALAGVVVLGGSWFAALTKPYVAPILLAERRWRQIGIGLMVAIVTVPFLPWVVFYDSRQIVLETFAQFAGNPVSASGNILLMAAVVVALISLGWRRGWLLFTPGLLAQQPHYLVFSLEAVKWSRILALAMTIPIQHTMAIGILSYALHDRLRCASSPRRTM